MISIYVGVMSRGTLHTNERPECPDYASVYCVPSDITL